MVPLSSSVSTSHVFGFLSRDAVLPIRPIDPKAVDDILLDFCATPDPVSLKSVAGLRISINGADATAAILGGLGARVDARGTSAAGEYRQALAQWLTLEEALGSDFPGSVRADRDIADRLGSMVPLSNNLKTFGSGDAGFGGNLHLINFLFATVPIAPLSIKELLQKVLGGQTAVQDVREIRFSTPVSGIGPHPAHGSIAASAQILYSTPDFEKLFNMLKFVQDALRQFPEGPFQRQLTDLKNTTDQIVSTTATHGTMLDSINQAILEVKRILQLQL
ncbi:MAG: hypothetical protein C5B51_28130 [Terriglobia bacterium]|nr:MAG: hypothetical protein C5B51_28130 [Terriglobia bacterium]